jgi:hypothetical protein
MRLAFPALSAAVFMLCAQTAPLRAQSTLGAGSVLCSQYLRAARSSDILFHQASNWLLGYVSGLDAAAKSAGGASPLAGLTSDQVLKAAGDYCGANPRSTIADAVVGWSATLPKQSAAPAPSTQEKGMWLRLEPAKSRPLLERH